MVKNAVEKVEFWLNTDKKVEIVLFLTHFDLKSTFRAKTIPNLLFFFCVYIDYICVDITVKKKHNI